MSKRGKEKQRVESQEEREKGRELSEGRQGEQNYYSLPPSLPAPLSPSLLAGGHIGGIKVTEVATGGSEGEENEVTGNTWRHGGQEVVLSVEMKMGCGE